VRTRERDLAAIENRLAAARGPAQLFAPPLSASEVQSALDEGSALLEFGTIGDELLAWVLTPGEVRVFRDMASRRAVEQAVTRIQFQLARSMRPGALDGPRGARSRDETRRELGLLWDMLLHPIREAIAGAQRIVVVPHGPLHCVPFHALWNGSEFWIEHAVIGYAPSASIWAGLRKRTHRATSRSALVIGVADEVAPRIEAEAREVAGILPAADLLVGSGAAASTVCSTAGGQSVIHFACHARFDRDLPHASGLRLADRWLTLRDIFGLRLSADLVTLGACDSGRSLVQAGDELVGLLRAFLAAGASCVLASLWPVQDDFSVALFRDLYRISNSDATPNSDPASYLRDVQLARLSDGVHPVLWAPYFAVGRT
jgi:CHAT domain-containing protein